MEFTGSAGANKFTLFDQAMVAGITDQFDPAVQSQFIRDIGPMTFDGTDADGEVLTDLAIGVSINYQFKNLFSREVRVSTEVDWSEAACPGSPSRVRTMEGSTYKSPRKMTWMAEINSASAARLRM